MHALSGRWEMAGDLDEPEEAHEVERARRHVDAELLEDARRLVKAHGVNVKAHGP